MTTTQHALLALIVSTVNGTPADLEPLSEGEWFEIYQLAQISKVGGFIYEIASTLPAGQVPPPSLLEEWHKSIMVRGLFQMRSEHALVLLLEELKKQNIPHVLFKGPVLASLYTSPSLRFSVDFDFFAETKDLEPFKKTLEGLGYIYNKESSKTHVSNWNLEDFSQLELHARLVEDYQDYRSTALESLLLTHPENLICLPTHLGLVTTLNHTNHLIYQIYHIAKHIMYHGIMLRNFVDTALFVNKYFADIDVAQFWQGIESMHYTKLCTHLLVACAVYFNMNHDILPPGTAVSTQAANLFMTDMMDTCFKKSDDELNSATQSFVFRSVTRKREAHNKAQHRTNRFKVLLSFIFPRPATLSNKYAYAKKYPFALPVAWVHRWLSVLFCKEGGASFSAQSYKKMRSLVNILENYDLLG